MYKRQEFLRGGAESSPHAVQQQPTVDQGAVIHTALCVEPRDGHLHVFMPPLERLEQYLDLLACVEQTAAGLQMPVRVEGYPPPADWRVRKFAVTPDPGAIEVNLHPARGLAALKQNLSGL